MSYSDLTYISFHNRVEVARLEKQTANEREKYQRNTRSLNAGLSTPPLLDIQYEVKSTTYLFIILYLIIISTLFNVVMAVYKKNIY